MSLLKAREAAATARRLGTALLPFASANPQHVRHNTAIPPQLTAYQARMSSTFSPQLLMSSRGTRRVHLEIAYEALNVAPKAAGPATAFSSHTPRHHRFFSTTFVARDGGLAEGDAATIDLPQLQKLREEDSALVIDVREPWEYASGFIPGAINIPLSEMNEAFVEMDDEEFEETYGRPRPAATGIDLPHNTSKPQMVVYCKAGVRSAAAQKWLEEHGFAGVVNYEGSFLEWQGLGLPADKP